MADKSKSLCNLSTPIVVVTSSLDAPNRTTSPDDMVHWVHSFQQVLKLKPTVHENQDCPRFQILLAAIPVGPHARR